jgi:hypothetical protein
MKCEDEFTEAIRSADIWSADTYLSLHWGWPYDIAEPGGKSHKRSDNVELIKGINDEFKRFMEKDGGKKKPFLLSEINADGDVNGPFEQAEQVKDFYDRIPADLPDLTGITFYQFRDRGRLGLEIEDPNDAGNGFAQPVLETYREIMTRPYFSPSMEISDSPVSFPCQLRWGGSEDADGIAVPLVLDGNPTFCEINFDGDSKNLSLMMQINGKWFYKKPGVNSIDFMPAFFDKPVKGETKLDVLIFATPAEGVNEPGQGADWDVNYYTEIKTPPTFRVRYKPTM